MKTDLGTIMKRFKALPPGALIGILVGVVLVFGLAGWFLLCIHRAPKSKT
jgi:hypothetical protein